MSSESYGTNLFHQLSENVARLLPDAWQGDWTEPFVGIITLLILSSIVHLIIRLWIIRLLKKLDDKTDSYTYNAILVHKVPQRALFFLPLMVLQVGFQILPEFDYEFTQFLIRLVNSTMILVGARTIAAILSTANTLYMRKPEAAQRPIKSYVQLGKVLTYLLAAIFIIAQLSGQSPWYFISGLGAITAIVLLLFRDTLLSLVASIQLTNNDLIRNGDWIEMPQFNADGDVVDIALNTVRVQNFDKTITVIPTHKFLEHSFRNWRGMQESGGRRIMRSLHIDLNSIRFLTYSEIQKLSNSHLLKPYIDKKMEEINAYNEKHLKDNRTTLTNGRWLTNIGTFRAYIMAYIKNHPRTHKSLLTLVRQLEPTSSGLPMQIYLFTNTTVWAEYEAIQADIFDHLIAVASEFDIKLYQQPSGNDMRAIGKTGKI